MKGHQNADPNLSSRSKRRGNNVRRWTAAGGMVKKSMSIRVIEKKEVRGDDPIKYLFPLKVSSALESYRG